MMRLRNNTTYYSEGNYISKRSRNVTQEVDGGEDMSLNGLGRSSSSDVAECNENDCELNHDVLRHIFSFLDLYHLKNCRLVSKTWNEEASRSLGEKSCFKINWESAVYLSTKSTLSKFGIFEAALSDKQRQKNGKNNIEKLFKSLSGLFNPSLFENFEFDLEWLLDKKLIRLLENFGSSLKRITIRDRKEFGKDLDEDCIERMDIVHLVLTEWCPALKTFQFEVARKTEVTTFPIEIEWVEPINVRELVIEGELTNYQSKFWIKLIKACPYLTKLTMSCIPLRKFFSSRSDETLICEWFFEQLSKLPLVTMRLVEFTWKGAWDRTVTNNVWGSIGLMNYDYYEETSCKILKAVSNMKFSNNLKQIGIGPSIDNSDVKNIYLNRLLKKINVCGTQEIVFFGKYWLNRQPPNLYFDDDDIEADDDRHFCSCDVDNHKWECLPKINHIPKMLKVTSIQNFARDNYKMGAFHLVHRFPNLKTYLMDSGPKDEENEDSFYVDFFDSELHYLCKFPHKILKKLLILRLKVGKPQTLELIIKGFPNLSYLEFTVAKLMPRSSDPSPRPPNITLKMVFSILSKCEHLEEFIVHFRSEHSSADLCEALEVMKDLPQLKRLTIDASKFKPKISLKNSKSSLSQLIDLTTSVTFVGYKVPKYQMGLIEKYCEANHIRAKFISHMKNQIYPVS